MIDDQLFVLISPGNSIGSEADDDGSAQPFGVGLLVGERATVDDTALFYRHYTGGEEALAGRSELDARLEPHLVGCQLSGAVHLSGRCSA